MDLHEQSRSGSDGEFRHDFGLLIPAGGDFSLGPLAFSLAGF